MDLIKQLEQDLKDHRSIVDADVSIEVKQNAPETKHYLFEFKIEKDKRKIYELAKSAESNLGTLIYISYGLGETPFQEMELDFDQVIRVYNIWLDCQDK